MHRNAGWKAWVADGWPTFSPNGRYVAIMTGRNFDENMYPDPVEFRRTRTGVLLRSFLGPSHAPPVWEDNHSVVVRVHKTDHRYAFLRLSRDGCIERTSRLLPYLHWPITMLEPVIFGRPLIWSDRLSSAE